MGQTDPKTRRIKELEGKLADLEHELCEANESIASLKQLVASKDAALIDARNTILKQDALLRKLTSAPNPYATVISKVAPRAEKEEPRLVIYSGSKYMEVSVPGGDPETVKEYFEKIRRGTVLKMTFETMQPIEIVPFHESLGPISAVRKVLPDGYAEVEDSTGVTKLVLTGDHKLETGDRVVLDDHGLIVTKNLGKEDQRFSVTQASTISWGDIGGLEDAKAALIDMIEMPFRHPEIYKKYSKSPPKGILFYGPPGCGKTLLGKATASALARIHGKEAGTGFLYVKGPEILSKWVGESEATIRSLFERSRAHKRSHGYPAVLFIDEADSILAKRGTGISSDMEKTIVPQFLAEMDGLEESAAIVILATNRPDILDPAVIREGRVDRKIKVGRPTRGMTAEIFKIHISKKPLAEGHSCEELAQIGTESLFSNDRSLYHIELHSGQQAVVTLGHIASGALIASIVEEAASIALHRDVTAGAFKGLTPDTITGAVDRLYREHKSISHKSEIEDLTSDWESDVKSITKIK